MPTSEYDASTSSNGDVPETHDQQSHSLEDNHVRTPSPDPTPASLPALLSSPLHFKASTFDQYSSTQEGNPASLRHKRLAEESDLRFVGSMPVSTFLEKFVPRARTRRPKEATLNISFADGEEPLSAEVKLLRAIKEGNVCPALKFFDTTSATAPIDQVNRRVDVRAFDADKVVTKSKERKKSKKSSKSKKSKKSKKTASDDQAPASVPQADYIWPWTEIWAELKRWGQDAYRDPDENMTPDELLDFDFQSATNDGVQTRGQMIEYATYIFASQQRVFFFSIFIMGELARLFRWDRCGAIVTERFNWREDPTTLAEFLWRFDHMTPEQRGHDMTVCSAPLEGELERARAAFREGDSNDFQKDEALHKVLVYDEDTDKTYGIIFGSPRYHSPSMFGRGTFGYLGFDLHTNRLVWLKDCWRVDKPEYPKEDSIYKKLAKENIPHTARKMYAGDVQDQVTRTQDFVGMPWTCWATTDLLPLRHYRLVIDKVGRPLSGFKSTRQLCEVIYDCILGHWYVYLILKILHRDISASNILIDKNDRGFLVDWDLSIDVSNPNQVVARRDFRSGTWQFSSGLLALAMGAKHHVLSDDLESFIHVFVFHLFRYLPSKHHIEDLVEDLQDVFDHHSFNGVAQRGGKRKRAFFSASNILATSDIKDLHPACATLVDGLRSLFGQAFYKDPEDVREAARAAARNSLSTSAELISRFQDSLADSSWTHDVKSASVDQLRNAPIAAKTVFEARHRKRKATIAKTWGSDWFIAQGQTHADEGEQERAPKRRRMATMARGAWEEASGPVLVEPDVDYI